MPRPSSNAKFSWLGIFRTLYFCYLPDKPEKGQFLRMFFNKTQSCICIIELTKNISIFGTMYCSFQTRRPSIYYVGNRTGWLGLENIQFCWRSVLYLCWHYSGSVGHKQSKICWRNIWMVPINTNRWSDSDLVHLLEGASHHCQIASCYWTETKNMYVISSTTCATKGHSITTWTKFYSPTPSSWYLWTFYTLPNLCSHDQAWAF